MSATRSERKPAGRLRALACAALIACVAWPASAAAQSLTERQLRARFQVNFVRFTEWPADAFAGAASPVELCVLGTDDPFDGALDELRGTVIAGRPIAVRGPVAASHVAGCHLLYVPDSELARLAAARQASGRAALLVVGESDAVLDRGGMIGLRPLDRRLGFAVNLGAVRRAGLKVSSQALKLAIEVRE